MQLDQRTKRRGTTPRTTRDHKSVAAMRQRLRDTLSGAAGYDTSRYIADDDLIALKTSAAALERFIMCWPVSLGDLSTATINLLANHLAESGAL